MSNGRKTSRSGPFVALVTGASHGIGAGIADRLARDGAHVVVGVQTDAIADEVRGRWQTCEGNSRPQGCDLDRRAGAVRYGFPSIEVGYGHGISDLNAEVVAADLRDRAACRALIDGCVDRHGRIDALVNNAAVTGAAAKQAFVDYPDDDFDELMDVNVGAAFRCSRQAARHMVDWGGGVIVNIGSVAGFAAQPEATPYAASKSALLGLTRGIALELGSQGVRAVYVAPGDIDTGVGPPAASTPHPWQRSTPLGRRGTPADVAAVVSFLCSPDAQFVSGTSWAVDGGWLSY